MNYLDPMKQWLCSIKNLCRCFNDIKILNLEKVFCDGLDIENKNLEQNTLKKQWIYKDTFFFKFFYFSSHVFFDIALWNCVNTL